MDRIIKFRGKDLLGKWRYGDLVQEKWKSKLNTNEKAVMIKKDKTAYIVLEDTVGQFTGLYDKNGKEIYEGDILELNKDGRIFYGTPDGLLAKKYQLVGFKDGAFMTCRNKHLIDDYDTYLWIISKYSTVAGNIYDNPELLEEEN